VHARVVQTPISGGDGRVFFQLYRVGAIVLAIVRDVQAQL